MFSYSRMSLLEAIVPWNKRAKPECSGTNYEGKEILLPYEKRNNIDENRSLQPETHGLFCGTLGLNQMPMGIW